MSGKVTIIDGNNEIELITVEKDIRAYMIKGEPGSDGISPTATVSKVDDTTTITITDKNGTTSSDVTDGFDPTITATRVDNTTTLTITDINGTRTANIYDGADNTGAVPTNGVIGWSDTIANVPNGYEITDSIQETLVSGTNIKTINSESLLGSGDITISGANVNDSYSTSTTESYSANYINEINTYSTTEKRIGTWNGKPLYRKVYDSYTLSGSGTQYLILDTDATKELARCYGTLVLGAFTTIFPTADAGLGYVAPASKNSSNQIYLTTDTTRTIGSLYCVLEYTKTTD